MESFPCAKPARLWQKDLQTIHCEYNNSLVLMVLNSLRP
jgi:hypothetical protein